jgi:hypothetical protein
MKTGDLEFGARGLCGVLPAEGVGGNGEAIAAEGKAFPFELLTANCSLLTDNSPSKTMALAPFSIALGIKTLPVVCVPGRAKKSEPGLTSRLSKTREEISGFADSFCESSVLPSEATTVYLIVDNASKSLLVIFPPKMKRFFYFITLWRGLQGFVFLGEELQNARKKNRRISQIFLAFVEKCGIIKL